MSEHDYDYLWDKSGPVDPEIQRLEMLLAPYRCGNLSPLALPKRRAWLFLPPFVLAGAVAAMVVMVGAWFVLRAVSAQTWTVSVLAGEGRLGAQAFSGSARLRAGEVFETGAGATARIRMPVGRLDVEPNTSLRLIESKRNQQRLSLLRGTIHARVSSPPRVFIVDTPSAVATDLGCAYTLHVDPSGDGLLRVTHGWIELEWRERGSLVPTGAVAVMRAGAGPGTPFFEDSSESFRAALSAYDFPPHGQPRSRALEQALHSAGPHDAVSLLNLVRNAPSSDRGVVYDTLARLVPPPAGANRAAALAGDPRALDPWWPAVGIGHAPAK